MDLSTSDAALNVAPLNSAKYHSSFKKKHATAKFTIKQILISNDNWWLFYQKHKKTLRAAILAAILKLLSCKSIVRGHSVYSCSNTACSHIKYIHHTCKSKACSSCGKKATELWITKQNQILPKTSWQHITFTMPSEFWDFFWCNRQLLNKVSSIAANSIKVIADKKHITPGIFTALHTFGRDLKRNIHIHLSVTTGGLSKNNKHWKNLYFDQATLMRIWRYAIIKLFHQTPHLIIPPAIKKQLNNAFTLNDFLNQLYQKTWIVYCSKPSNDHKQNVNYLARYIKRPAVAESKLKHYDGNEVVFNYLDHTTKTYRRFALTAEDFIGRFVQHIPDTGFRMIRYYGFLAHRVRGKLLQIIYQLLGQENIPISPSPTFSELMQKDFHFNPLICILCGSQLFLTEIHFGLSTAQQLFPFHKSLALLQRI